MSHYVVHHDETTVLLEVKNRKGIRTTSFVSQGAAKAALTKQVNAGKVKREDYVICEARLFHDHIELNRRVRNMMSGGWVTESVNTLWTDSVQSETYHCS